MAKSIMIQGTMSNAGKSLVAAALCRIFTQDGYKCMPFKSQNMALNSYITKNGLEMGRAQVMQAEACYAEPDVLMNPILLKPTTDTGSQIILNGRPIGNMTASEYFRHKTEFIPDIMKAYHELEKQCDIIVIEGAGSPAELNLKSDDIVNMGMARLAKSPVLLVGDIDRGGIFAQLIGTVKLLEKSEQDMIKALIVNKFRGDKNIFRSGCEILEEKSGKRVAGVIPYVNCDIDDEDSLSERLENSKEGVIEIAVIRLPKISNFTDFNVFSQYEGVSVKYVSKPENLENPDLIIIPGTKSTISDMKFLRESGLECKIKKLVSSGTLIFGICGGFQMLGKKISDPLNTESGGEISGMGLLDISTVFCSDKTQLQTKGIFSGIGGAFSCLNGLEFEGYEIHMGKTSSDEKTFLKINGKKCGAYKNNVYGCYIHGIFDSGEISERIVKKLYELKNLEYNECKKLSRSEYKDMQYNILADEVRKNIDLNLIYRIISDGADTISSEDD